MSEDQTTPIRAAGGIVKGVGRNTGKIAVVVRKRYKDKAGQYERGLPKGKPKPQDGGSALKNALREVKEETGVEATSGKYLRATEYEVDGRPKRVDYFLMEAPDDLDRRPGDPDEIEAVKWLTPAEAIVALTHEEDRRLVQYLSRNVLREARSIRRLFTRWSGSAPERGRLDGAINDALIDLSLAGKQAQESSWWQGANQHLARAQEYLADRDLQQGWYSLASANRFMVLGETSVERLRSAATKLLKEASKLSDWRAKAVVALISRDEGKTLDNSIVNQPMRLVQALAIRDDQFETNYFKIELRRRHLMGLAGVLLACIVTTLVFSLCRFLPAPLNNFPLLVAVVLFGAMGAALSVARSLLKTDVAAKIPSQKLGAFVIWMRLVIGAAAALIAFVFVSAGGFHLINLDSGNPTAVLTIATISGFSERFIVGAIENLANDKGSSESGD